MIFLSALSSFSLFIRWASINSKRVSILAILLACIFWRYLTKMLGVLYHAYLGGFNLVHSHRQCLEVKIKLFTAIFSVNYSFKTRILEWYIFLTKLCILLLSNFENGFGNLIKDLSDSRPYIRYWHFLSIIKCNIKTISKLLGILKFLDWRPKLGEVFRSIIHLTVLLIAIRIF